MIFPHGNWTSMVNSPLPQWREPFTTLTVKTRLISQMFSKSSENKKYVKNADSSFSHSYIVASTQLTIYEERYFHFNSIQIGAFYARKIQRSLITSSSPVQLPRWYGPIWKIPLFGKINITVCCPSIFNFVLPTRITERASSNSTLFHQCYGHFS